MGLLFTDRNVDDFNVLLNVNIAERLYNSHHERFIESFYKGWKKGVLNEATAYSLNSTTTKLRLAVLYLLGRQHPIEDYTKINDEFIDQFNQFCYFFGQLTGFLKTKDGNPFTDSKSLEYFKRSVFAIDNFNMNFNEYYYKKFRIWFNKKKKKFTETQWNNYRSFRSFIVKSKTHDYTWNFLPE